MEKLFSKKQIIILLALIGLSVSVMAQGVSEPSGSIAYNFLILIGLIVLLLILLPYIRKRNSKIDALGEETYNELKNNFDAKKIIEELNYCIEVINEYWEQNEFFREPDEGVRKKLLAPAPYTRVFLKMMSPQYSESERIKEEKAKLFKSTKKTLDDYIKKQWNPRIKILRENSSSYYSDKALRDAYTQAIEADKEIQKLTIEGKAGQEFNKTLKVAGFALAGCTVLAIGTVSAANSFGLKQSIRDNL